LGRLLWFELHQDVHEATAREKRIKRWRRERVVVVFPEFSLENIRNAARPST
jgi:predicted GIY-YIG superfamily endonuclease